MTWRERAINLWREGRSWSEIVAVLSSAFPEEQFDKDKVRGPIRKLPEYKDRNLQSTQNVIQPHKKVIMINKDGSRESDTVISGTEEQMGDAEYLLRAHGFNPAEWNLVWAKNSVYNVQLKGGKVDTFYSSKITVQPKVINEEEILKNFIEKAEKYSPVSPRKVEPRGEHILLVNICDLHFGQLSWGVESGENYDYKIATRRFQEIISDAISKAPPVPYEKIVFVVGNDYFNSDNMEGKTTKGTQQTNDIRPQKMFDKGTDLLIWAIDALRSGFPTTPIETVLVSGNHDRLSSFCAAKVVYAWFRNDPTVAVDMTPRLHKGFAYGDTALLFTHGQNELKNLDWVYSEFRHLIGRTKRTEIHAGHMHRVKVEEKNGALIRVNPSLSALDNWSYSEGYGPTAQAITRVYSREGLEYEIYSRPRK